MKFKQQNCNSAQDLQQACFRTTGWGPRHRLVKKNAQVLGSVCVLLPPSWPSAVAVQVTSHFVTSYSRGWGFHGGEDFLFWSPCYSCGNGGIDTAHCHSIIMRWLSWVLTTVSSVCHGHTWHVTRNSCRMLCFHHTLFWSCGDWRRGVNTVSWPGVRNVDFSVSTSYLHLLLFVNKSYLDFQTFSLLSEFIVAQPCMRTSNTVNSEHRFTIAIIAD